MPITSRLRCPLYHVDIEAAMAAIRSVLGEVPIVAAEQVRAPA